jgi:DNA-binding MarR family transcriptional regulator
VIKDTLNTKEAELINIIGAECAASQRDFSRHLNISLGATHMLLRRLVEQGYIHIRQVTKRKIEYTLTPKGLSERLEKSRHCTLETIRSIKRYKQTIRDIVRGFYRSGERDFWACGDEEVSWLVQSVFKEEEFQGCRFRILSDEEREDLEDGVLFICRPQAEPPGWLAGKRVNVFETLAREIHL